MHVDKERARAAFADYVGAYDPSNPRIALKVAHTHRVAQLCERIAPREGDLSWLCGMLHDIGRFEQVRRFDTFNDAKSVSHASLGVDVLFGNADPAGPRIRAFVEDSTDDELVRTAIATHSDYELPSEFDGRTRMHCNVLRDADKIDIFRVNCDTPLGEIYNVTTEDLKNSFVSEEVKECFRNRTAVLRKLKKTPIDYVVAHLCLVFELVYPISRVIARKQGYADRMLSFESDNPDTAEWFAMMRSTIWE